MYVFDADMVWKLIETYKATLLQMDWEPTPDQVIIQISREWYELDDPIMPFICDLFGDRHLYGGRV
jgi:hypothetical protein